MKRVLVHVLLVNNVGFCVEKAYLATALTALGSIWQEDKYGSALPRKGVTCKWVMGNMGPGEVDGEDGSISLYTNLSLLRSLKRMHPLCNC